MNHERGHRLPALRDAQHASQTPCSTYVQVQKKFLSSKSLCTYSVWDLRRDVRRSPGRWHDLILQLWSKLNPDPAAGTVSRIASLPAYVNHLVEVGRQGRLRTPPARALQRRNAARRDRQKKWRDSCVEARMIAETNQRMLDQIQQSASLRQAVTRYSFPPKGTRQL
jgi:hypothetical protein